MADVDEEILVKFAKKLAGNEKKYRNRALKKLRKWLETRSTTGKGQFSREDFLKIWKGLHYCMWMADKPLVQEELADNLSQLIQCFHGNPDTALLFVDVFFETECREWGGIDRLRLDKFMMLVRRVFRHSLILLKQLKWRPLYLDRLLTVFSKQLICGDFGSAPDGLRYHMADIYMDEVSSVAGNELSKDQVLTILKPYGVMLSRVSLKPMMTHIVKRVFMPLIDNEVDAQTANEEDKEVELNQKGEESQQDQDQSDQEETCQLKVDFVNLADFLFELASKKECVARNRKIIYELVTVMRDLDKGLTPQPKTVSYQDLNDHIPKWEMERAVGRLQKFEDVMRRDAEEKKKRKRRVESESEEPVKKKKRKKQRKNGEHVEESDITSPVPMATDSENETEEPDLSEGLSVEKDMSEVRTTLNKDDLDEGDHESKVEIQKGDKKKRKKQKIKENGDLQMSDERVMPPGVSSSDDSVEEHKDDIAGDGEVVEFTEKDMTPVQGDEGTLFTGGFDEDEDCDNAEINAMIAALAAGKETVVKERSSQSQQRPKKKAGKKNKFKNVKAKVSSPVDGSQEKQSVNKSPSACKSIRNETESCDTPVSKSQKKKGKKSKTQSSPAEGDSGEVEIVIPNKKYKGKLKGWMESEVQKNLSPPASETFAKFDTGTKTPVAFVRRAAAKVARTDPKRKKKVESPKEPGSAPPGGKKRVSFAMNKNQAQEFVASVAIKSASPFNPTAQPENSILKSPVSGSSTPVQPSPRQQLFKKKRAKAADFL